MYSMEASPHLCLERKSHPPPMGISSEPALKLTEVSRKLLAGSDSSQMHKASRARRSLSLSQQRQEQIALEYSCQSDTPTGPGSQCSMLSMVLIACMIRKGSKSAANTFKGCHTLYLYAECEQQPLQVPQPGEAISALPQGRLICSASLLSFVFSLFIASRLTSVILI